MRAWAHRMREDRIREEKGKSHPGRLEDLKTSYIIVLIN